MSIPRQMTVNCPKCGTSLTATVFESINTDFCDGVPEQIISGDLFNVECPHCKYVSHLEYDILYHDLQHEAMVWVVHKNAPSYNSKISDIRSVEMPPYSMLRIVEDMNALKEKVSCLEAGRDDRIIELCKVFIFSKLIAQYPNFQLHDTYYTVIDGKERIYFFDNDGNNQCCDSIEEVYDDLKDIYYSSTYVSEFNNNYPIVDYRWAESILLPLLEKTASKNKGNDENVNHLLCPHCSSKLPSDSEFCQYCGKKIEIPRTSPESASTHSSPTISIKANKMRIWIVLFLIISSLSIALNIYQYFSYEEKLASALERLSTANDTISTLEKEVASQERAIKINEQSIDYHKDRAAALGKKANYYDDIISGMKYGNAGYASSNFCASDSVIIVSKNETNQKFKLTANWSNGGTVYVDYSSTAAWVSFDNDEWQTSTQMTVHPRSEGVTIVTFSNSVNSKTFKVLIIVTA